MKQIIVFLVILSSYFICYSESTRVQVGDLFYNITGSTASVTRNLFSQYTCQYDHLYYEIPERIYYNGSYYTVTAIEDRAFSAYESDKYTMTASKVQNITIPRTITKIGKHAFHGCKNLNTVTIDGAESALEEIGSEAFANCIKLEFLRIPSKVKVLGENVFKDSSIQILEYFGAIPPENWVAANTTYVTNKKSFSLPSAQIDETYNILEFINFETSEFIYNGERALTSWSNNSNRYSDPKKWIITAEIPELESQAGEYCTEIQFHYKLSYNSFYDFSLTIPYYYVIQPLTLDVVVNDEQRLYGEDNPSFSYAIYGFLNGENETVLSQQPSLTCTADKNSDVGTYCVKANGGEAQNYIFNYHDGSLEIKKSPLSIKVNDESKVYGDMNPEFSMTYIGLRNTESTPMWVESPTFHTSVTRESNVGNYDLTVTCMPKNYEVIENKPGQITVTQAPLILKALDTNRSYYEDNPTFEFTLIGLRNTDTKSCITTGPIYRCSASHSSNVGQYIIEPSAAEALNYAIEYQNGILNIEPCPLVISVGNYSRKYNTENPIFDISYEGFVNNEDSSVLSQQPSVSCTATKTSDVGSYILTPKGGEAENYIITQYHNGVLTIEKADQTIIWNQDLSNVDKNSQIALTAISDADLDITYDMSPNNVATLYNNAGVNYLDCYGSGAVNIRAIQNGNKNYNAAPIIEKTLVVNGIEEDPSVPQIYLNVKIAGSLPSMIAENRKYEIESLRLSGNLNGTDLRYIREMAGSDIYGDPTSGHLQVLDLSECKIVSGGEPYFHTTYGTSSNVIGEHMFYNCKSLVTLHLPNNITSLEDYAIAGCDALTIVSLPSTLEYIRSYAFHDDINLLRIHLPNKIRSIGDMAFSGCIQLTELTIPQNVKYIGEGILSRCQNIIQINVEDNPNYMCLDGVLFSKSLDKLLIYPANYSLDEYSIPEGVKGIASYAFLDAKNLKSISLPKTLRSIGSDVFLGCINLSSITVLALDPPICDNDCFDKANKTHCQLIVPKGCYSYYWVAPVWAEFNKIIEFDDSGIEEISDTNFSITSESNTITIVGLPMNTHIFIFRSDGILVHDSKTRGEEYKYTLNASGAYIIAFEDKTYKMFIK